MNRTQSTGALPTTGRDVLTRALAGLRTGQIVWGRDQFRDPITDCSCLIGVIAWATDPTYEDRDPFVMDLDRRQAAREALNAVAAVLDERGELPPHREERPELTDERLQPLELLAIGEWNDALPNALPVLEVLEAALERAR